MGAVPPTFFIMTRFGMAQDTQTIIERIREVVVPILSSMGLELVDLELSGHGRRGHLRIFIDKAGGVNVDDCEQVSRYVGHALDAADPIPNAYLLEVSSPGLDRPLRKAEDYQRATGKLARLKLTRPLDGEWVIIGRLQGLQGNRVEIQSEDREPVQIALADIAQARLEVEW
ncbi:MAG: ribosome maturation factor RimP [Nitrospirae bacterium]|nr:ribosome maturation factor RimP [Nitrospirota bacterium]